METDYISRQWLLTEYDKRHKGPTGGARKMIEEAPASDVRPVARGEWMDTEDTYADPPARQTCRCSNCGKVSPRPLGDFCRWCGADMTGGADG